MEYFFFFFMYIILALSIILVNNPIHAILNLILIFFLSACFSIYLGIEFLALLILLIYIGAIIILFLFIVMLLNIKIIELNVFYIKYWWIGILYSFLFFLYFFYVWHYITISNFFDKNIKIEDKILNNFINFSFNFSNLEALGELLYLYYPHLLIFSTLILFTTIVSPVVLTYTDFKKKKNILKKNIFLKNIQTSIFYK